MSDITKTMLEKATQAMRNAYNPYSKFSVGACIRATDGNLYSACNVENASYSLTICAESSAIVAMVAAGSKKIAELVLVVDHEDISTPCGACRQRIVEFVENRETPIHCFNNRGDCKTFTITELLPEAFILD